MTGVPWHVKGVHPAARETARHAARRSGLSVGKWLNSVILESADRDDETFVAAPLDRPMRPAGSFRPKPAEALEPEISALNARFDHLNRQIERLIRTELPRREEMPQPGGPAGERISDAVERLEAKLDLLIGGRTREHPESRRAEIDRALARAAHERLGSAYGGGTGGLDQAVAEIAARQRALDGDPPAREQPPAPAVSTPPAPPAPDFSKLEQCLREVTSRLEALQTPCRASDLADALRQELADMRQTVAEAMPRGALEALDGQVRALGARLDAQRATGLDGAALTGFEHTLFEIRNAVHGLAPIESLAGLDAALDRLTQKLDLVAARNQDPDALRQLEAGIEGLRGVVAHIASADALSSLAGEIRTLGERIDRSQRTDPDLVGRLEARIAAIGDAIESRRLEESGSARAELDDLVRAVAAKLESLQLSRADQSALAHLEERMTQLAAKLDASDARLSHLDAIERGVAELLVHLDQLRPRLTDNAPAAADVAALEALSRDIAALRQGRSDTDQRTQDLLDAMHGTIAQVADRLATIETEMRSPDKPEPAAVAVRVAAAAASPIETPATRAPISPPASPPIGAPASPQPAVQRVSPPPAAPPAAPAVERRAPAPPEALAAKAGTVLPPDTPLEPGTGMPRTAASAMERIAASQAAAGGASPAAEAQVTAKSSFIVAARRAAQAAASEQQSKGRAAPEADGEAKAPGKLVERVKSLIAGASVILIVCGAALGVRGYLDGSLPFGSPSKQSAETKSSAVRAPASGDAVSAQSLIPLTTANIPALVRAKEPEPPPAAPPAAPPALAAKADDARIPVAKAEPDPSPTGALPHPRDAALAPERMSATPSTPLPPAPDPLPPTIGGRVLLAAAAAGDPAAAYEVGARYTEGRGVTQDPAAAAAWFARAAAAGLAPAQFRLGSMYEKGVGVTKDLAEAHRLYVAAATKGNAKAMHNLAVLNAEGYQGKPDYTAAAQWFQKAASYGVTDSQYNLGILYARGIGVEQNLAESYKWFALAARSGDPDSAKKRDDVGGRLDQQALVAARLAAQTFVAETQPEDAIAVKAPPGGWDEAAAPAKPKVRIRPRAG